MWEAERGLHIARPQNMSAQSGTHGTGVLCDNTPNSISIGTVSKLIKLNEVPQGVSVVSRGKVSVLHFTPQYCIVL